LLLLQVPPPVLLLSVVDVPTHVWAVPVIGAGVTLTVTVAVDAQPVDNM
jgi:hypothetical protein